jgi:hypothetical protein
MGVRFDANLAEHTIDFNDQGSSILRLDMFILVKIKENRAL